MGSAALSQEATRADGMAKKEALEAEGCTLRLTLQRRKQGYGLVSHPEAAAELRRELDEVTPFVYLRSPRGSLPHDP